MAVDAAHEAALVEQIAKFTTDPAAYIAFAFPWGEPGSELAKHTGLRTWQAEVCAKIKEKLSNAVDLNVAVLEAVASGKGVGKSSLIAMLIMWAMSTRANTRCVITANTMPQLMTKTWPELAKWHRMAINKHWFTFTATSLYSTSKSHEKTWRADAIPWNEQNPEAFAGLHNQGSRILLVFDEASGVHDKIWETSEGVLTDANTEIIWLAFGNPTRNTGRFRECFGRFKHRWGHRHIDSRTVEGTNKDEIQKWIEDYGEDHDFVRVNVTSQFPRVGQQQFISSEVIFEAANREATSTLYDPLIIGVDVARFGDDESSITFRRGNDARTISPITLRGVDTMTLVGHICHAIEEHHPDAIFVDETGVGAGVVDRLKQLGHAVMGVNNGARPDGPVGDELVSNKGAECWAKMRAWLKHGAIPNDQDLIQQLEGRQYGYNQHNQISLEKKDDMKKRGLSSPDRADSMALTLAYHVGKNHYGLGSGTDVGKALMDYDPLSADRL